MLMAAAPAVGTTGDGLAAEGEAGEAAASEGRPGTICGAVWEARRDEAPAASARDAGCSSGTGGSGTVSGPAGAAGDPGTEDPGADDCGAEDPGAGAGARPSSAGGRGGSDGEASGFWSIHVRRAVPNAASRAARVWSGGTGGVAGAGRGALRCRAPDARRRPRPELCSVMGTS
ncbi:hypothetical protein GCM10009793_09480 [Brachybacterium phenoliresistens]